MIGDKTEVVEAFWQDCRRQYDIQTSRYHTSTFADPRFAPYHDMLLDLVRSGRKRATAHLLEDFERNRVPRRGVGDYWVVLDVKNTPTYLIRITDVTIKPFNQVDAAFAAREGEGDCSLQYWQQVHRDYFKQQCTDWGIDWSEGRRTVCEGFELIHSTQDHLRSDRSIDC